MEARYNLPPTLNEAPTLSAVIPDTVTTETRVTDIQATFSGAFAWYVATMAIQPLETVRMHVQLQTPIGEKGTIQAALALLHHRGLGGLFRGSWLAWIKTFPEFVAKNLVLNNLKFRSLGTDEMSPSTATMFPRVLLSTVFARLITSPLDMCKLRAMQWTEPRAYTGLYDTGRRILLEEGIGGLIKGLPFGLLANFAYSLGIALVSPYTHKLALAWSISTEISRGLASLVAMFVAYPFETVKRRVQSSNTWSPLTSLPGHPIDSSSLQIISHLWKNNWTLFWAGFPLCALTFIAKNFIVRSSQIITLNFFLWNNGYTVSMFDSTPLPKIPQNISPDELMRSKRWDNRAPRSNW